MCVIGRMISKWLMIWRIVSNSLVIYNTLISNRLLVFSRIINNSVFTCRRVASYQLAAHRKIVCNHLLARGKIIPDYLHHRSTQVDIQGMVPTMHGKPTSFRHTTDYRLRVMMSCLHFLQ